MKEEMEDKEYFYAPYIPIYKYEDHGGEDRGGMIYRGSMPYYREKSVLDMSDFERARYILLITAYNKGMWESVRATQAFYYKILVDKSRSYNAVIENCYDIIRKLREEGRIE